MFRVIVHAITGQMQSSVCLGRVSITRSLCCPDCVPVGLMASVAPGRRYDQHHGAVAAGDGEFAGAGWQFALV